MKRSRQIASILAMAALIFTSLACSSGSQLSATSTPVPSKNPTVAPTLTPSFTPTPDYSARVLFFASVFAGPGVDYPNLGTITGSTDPNDSSNTVTIIGQAYICEWLEVTLPWPTQNNQLGWVHAADLKYTVDCADIPPGEIPPLPTSMPRPTSTKTRMPPVKTLPPASGGGSPATQAPAPQSCNPSDTINVNNETEGTVVLTLTGGPKNYTFIVPKGNQMFYICSGTYQYAARGCGASFLYGTITGGSSMDLICSVSP